MKKILAILLLMCCALPVMAKKRQNEEIITPLTQLEKRQFQTKSYPAQDNIVAMKSVLNVLQDEGFIVYNVNSLLGYIYGVKDFDLSDPNIDISKEFGLTKSRLNYNGVRVATLEVSINVTQYGEQTRIRTNFKRKLFNEYGNAQMIEDISEQEYYADFYKKVDSAIVLQKQIAQKVKKEEMPVSVKRPAKSKPPVSRPMQKPAPVVIQEPQQNVEPNQTELQVPEQLNISTDSQMVKQEEITSSENMPETVTNTEKVELKPDTAEVTHEQPQEVKIKHEQEAGKTVEKQDSVQQSEVINDMIPEHIFDSVPVDIEPEHIKTPKEEAKELKELVKQAKLEVKQAQKEAQQAQKEAMQLQKDLDREAFNTEKQALKAEKEAQKQAIKAEKEAQKEAKRQAKEMR